MKQRTKSKYVHEGQYVAEVEVALVEDDMGWSSYLSVEDANKLDDVKDALRQGDLATTSPGRAPLLRSALNVVSPAHIRGAASTGDNPSGITATALAGTMRYSA